MAAKTALGLRIIAVVKLLSACLLAATAFGIFHYVHMGANAEQLIVLLRLDPEKHVVHTILASITNIPPHRWKEIGAGTLVYALLHMIEGTGLLLGKVWAEYVTVAITGSFLPLEAYEVAHKLSIVRVGMLAINIAIVVYLVCQIRRTRRR